MSLDLNTRVLIVDDYKTTIRIIQSMLRQIGLQNLEDAVNGEEAYAKLKARRFGLVISDWNMHPVTGFELLCKVRAEEDLKSIPFILITAESKTENVIAAKRAGVNNYIVKPFNAATLKEKLISIFGAF
jgi:two-component system chemotaxis response regulator CheY